jgi:type III secretion protein J
MSMFNNAHTLLLSEGTALGTVAAMKSLVRRAVLAAATCLLSVMLMGCSQQELYGQLNESQANEMVAALRNAGLAAEKTFSRDGKSFAVSTKADDFARAVEVLRAGGLPKPSFDTLGSVFKKEGFVSSPEEERARLIYALSQELSNMLSGIDGVVHAKVLVSVPEKNPLSDKPTPATASVAITHQPGLDLSQDVGKIKALVVNAMDRLPYDNVTVALFPAAPIPPPLPRTEWAMTFGGFGWLMVLGGAIGGAALMAGLLLWIRRPASAKAKGDSDDLPHDGTALTVHRPPLHAVSMDGSRTSSV